jgi:hypothetical protein
MGIRLYKPYTASKIDLFQILVKLHNQARKVIDTLQCSKDEITEGYY